MEVDTQVVENSYFITMAAKIHRRRRWSNDYAEIVCKGTFGIWANSTCVSAHTSIRSKPGVDALAGRGWEREKTHFDLRTLIARQPPFRHCKLYLIHIEDPAAKGEASLCKLMLSSTYNAFAVCSRSLNFVFPRDFRLRRELLEFSFQFFGFMHIKIGIADFWSA